ncbi:hypothetical protein ACJJTC_005208 [Scirpophaga incertulas]
MDRYNFNVPEFNSTINKIIDISHHRISWNISQVMTNGELEDIDKKIHSLKEHEALPASISSHDIHHYAIGYILLGAAIISFTVWLIKKRYYGCCPCKKRTAELPIYNEIELKQRGKHTRQEQMAQGSASQQPPAQRPRPLRATATAANADDNITFNFDT